MTLCCSTAIMAPQFQPEIGDAFIIALIGFLASPVEIFTVKDHGALGYVDDLAAALALAVLLIHRILGLVGGRSGTAEAPSHQQQQQHH